MGWITGWTYRKLINISGSAGAGTNYQVKFLVGESSGSSGYDFHLEGHSSLFPSSKGDGGDLRFTAEDGETLLNFWVETVTGVTPNRVATVWVEITDDLDSDVVIYCYYGNSLATNVASGDDTFLFFDDFDGTTLDSTKWTVCSGSNYSISNSILDILPSSWTIIGAKNNYPPGHAFEFYAKFTEQNNNQIRADHDADAGQSNYKLAFANYGSARFETRTSDGTWYTSRSDLFNSDFRRGTMAYLDHEAHFYVDGQHKTQNSGDRVPSESLGFQFDVAVSGSEMWVDWVAVRKYIYSEPSFSSSGIEESGTSGVLEDLKLDILAFCQTLDDISLDLDLLGASLEDLDLDFYAWKLVLQDYNLDLKAYLRELEDLPISLKIANYDLLDLYMNLELIDDTDLIDVLMNLYLTDGTAYEDIKLNLLVIDELPTFKGIYALHLGSVLYDVT